MQQLHRVHGKFVNENSRTLVPAHPEDSSWGRRDQEINQISLALVGALRDAQETARLSKNALAQKAGISESGTNSPSITTFLRFCSALEIDPAATLERATRP